MSAVAAVMWVMTIGGCGQDGGNPVPAPATVGSAVVDLGGNPVDPFGTGDAKAVVLVFAAIDCPISNRYAPELRRLHNEFAGKGVVWWRVHANSGESVESIRAHAVEYGWPGGVVRDPSHELVRRAGASVTPEAAVFLANGERVYHGRIDDWYVDYGKKRSEPAQRDLRDAIAAILEGRPVVSASNKAVGCLIQKAE